MADWNVGPDSDLCHLLFLDEGGLLGCDGSSAFFGCKHIRTGADAGGQQTELEGGESAYRRDEEGFDLGFLICPCAMEGLKDSF